MLEARALDNTLKRLFEWERAHKRNASCIHLQVLLDDLEEHGKASLRLEYAPRMHDPNPKLTAVVLTTWANRPQRLQAAARGVYQSLGTSGQATIRTERDTFVEDGKWKTVLRGRAGALLAMIAENKLQTTTKQWVKPLMERIAKLKMLETEKDLAETETGRTIWGIEPSTWWEWMESEKPS